MRTFGQRSASRKSAITASYRKRSSPRSRCAYPMSEDPAPPSLHRTLEIRLAHIEARLTHLESELDARALVSASVPSPPALAPAFPPNTPGEDELEFTIRQNWFARAGIFVLTVGVALLLLLPYAALP